VDISFDSVENFFFLGIFPRREGGSIKCNDVESINKSFEFLIYSIDAQQFDKPF
jgi:hypothetical protein